MVLDQCSLGPVYLATPGVSHSVVFSVLLQQGKILLKALHLMVESIPTLLTGRPTQAICHRWLQIY